MSFFRKAFHKISHSQDGTVNTVKPAPSTAALPALSFQHDFGVAVWDGTGLRDPNVVPIRVYNSDSSRSPSSMISLTDKDIGFNQHDTAPLPPPKLTVTKNASLASTTSFTKTDESLRPRTPKKSSASSFRPFLTNLAGLKISSLDKDTRDPQDPDQSDLSLPLPTPDPLSSNASTPSSILPPPLSRGAGAARRRRQQNPSIERAVQSANATYLLPLSFDNTTVVDAAMTKRLEQAANQARLNAALTSESTSSLHFELDEPAVSRQAPSIQVEADRLLVDNEPGPSNSPSHSLRKSGSHLPQTPIFDGPLSSNGSLVFDPAQDTHVYPTLDELDRTLEKTDSKVHPQTLQDNEGENNLETQDPDARDIHDIVIDDYVASYTTPPPLPLPQEVTGVHKLLRLLRSRLEESKARIDALNEEKLHMMQTHHREVVDLSDKVKTLEQKENGYRAYIKDLVSENKRLMTDNEDVVHQLKSQIEENENFEKLNKELRKESLEFRDFKSKMRDTELEYQQLFKEKDSWQGQIDSMHQRLSHSERRVRCLDIITRQKYEAKMDGAYGSGSVVGRSTKLHFSPHVKGPSMDVITSVTIFNEEVLQTASYIVEHLEETPSNAKLSHNMPKEVARAKEIWGSRVVTMLQDQAKSSSRLNILLLKNCLEVFMTHWCAQIVEGWYPKQPSFSDILVELTSQTTSVVNNGFAKQICGKQLKIVPTDSGAPDFASWVKDVVQDLTSVFAIGGVRMPVLKTSLLPSKIEPLLKLAYNLRLALAERDICGGLEIAAPSPDVPFHPQFMEDAEEFAVQKSRKKKVDSHGPSWVDGEYIAGTNGIGLKRTLNGQPGVYEMVVKPKVSLIRVLETVF